MPRRQLIVPKREEALAFAKGDSLLSKNQDSEQSLKQNGKQAGEPIFARVSPDVYEGVCTALAKAKAKKMEPRKLQHLVDEALREWLEKRGYLEHRAA
jgi:hypothetical protein